MASKTSDNSIGGCILNMVLCGASGFGLFKIGPSEHPWAFTACLIGFTHGLVGLVSELTADENAKKIQQTTAAIMDIVPLPLVNVDLFLGSESNIIAVAHGLFMVPLTVSVILAFWKDEGEESELKGSVNTLKVLTILGNITALVFLTMNEFNGYLAGMAVLAFMAKLGADLCEEHVLEGSRQPIFYISWSGFFILAAIAVSAEK